MVITKIIGGDSVRVALVYFTLLVLTACATVPGKTRKEQVDTVDSLVSKTLADLEKQTPATKEEITQSVGYVVMSNKITKIPVFGAGGGYGVAIDNKSGEKTYLRLARFDFGAGWGARSVRPVLIFHDEKKFARFVDGTFEVNMGAEASAKVGEKGAAGGAGSTEASSKDPGYKSYLITDAGVSATVSLCVIRVKPIKLRKEDRL